MSKYVLNSFTFWESTNMKKMPNFQKLPDILISDTLISLFLVEYYEKKKLHKESVFIFKDVVMKVIYSLYYFHQKKIINSFRKDFVGKWCQLSPTYSDLYGTDKGAIFGQFSFSGFGLRRSISQRNVPFLSFLTDHDTFPFWGHKSHWCPFHAMWGSSIRSTSFQFKNF